MASRTCSQSSVARLPKLTSQLLSFARRQALQPEVFEVGERMRGVSDMLNAVTGARIRIVTEVPDTPCHVRSDPSQFETALINLAVNARDAMDGAGTLTLRLDCGVPLPGIRGHAGALGPFAAVWRGDCARATRSCRWSSPRAIATSWHRTTRTASNSSASPTRPSRSPKPSGEP